MTVVYCSVNLTNKGSNTHKQKWLTWPYPGSSSTHHRHTVKLNITFKYIYKNFVLDLTFLIFFDKVTDEYFCRQVYSNKKRHNKQDFIVAYTASIVKHV